MSLRYLAPAAMSALLLAAPASGALAGAAASVRSAPDLPADPRPELLRQLDGQWVMRGDVRGEPVTYDLEVRPVLDAAFSELHMRDAAAPSQYEARVFIGADPADGTVIVHWLDSFGARFSIPHGTGRIEGDLLEFTVPYPDGAFRDRLRRDPSAGTWTFVIEAAQPDGSWAHFARYELSRRDAVAQP